MDNDRTCTNDCRWICVIVCTNLVVVDDHITVILVPDLDPELVTTTATSNVTVNGGQEKPIVPSTVDRAGALKLSTCARDHQPLVAGAVEVQLSNSKSELRLTRWGVCPLLIFGDEAKRRLARERGINCVGTGQRVTLIKSLLGGVLNSPLTFSLVLFYLLGKICFVPP